MEPKVWPVERAQIWGRSQPWRTGCNFIPSTAINQLEMWQADTFDPTTIDRELGWAASIGMSVVRVFLSDQIHEIDSAGLIERMHRFLDIAAKHRILACFTFFDDCHQPEMSPGKQPEPKPGVHNSGWVKSPVLSKRSWPTDLPRLEKYVKHVLAEFGSHPGVWMWDLYNEPANDVPHEVSLPLLESVFKWAWEVRPEAPLTCGIWNGDPILDGLLPSLSDVTSFHTYGSAADLEQCIAKMKKLGRPVVCTEWLARTVGSVPKTHLAIFKSEKVHCLNWGLVSGKSGTKYPWGSPEGAPEPDPWFHDLFHPDGTPYRQDEVDLFRELTR